jgi:hypothetical protein
MVLHPSSPLGSMTDRVRGASALFGRTPKSCVISSLWVASLNPQTQLLGSNFARIVAIGLLGRSAEYEVQAGREHHVVLFDAARCVAHVAIDVERVGSGLNLCLLSAFYTNTILLRKTALLRLAHLSGYLSQVSIP